MSAFRQTENTINIDGHEFSLQVLLAFDPSYIMPSGYSTRFYAPNKKHYLSSGYDQIAGPIPWEQGDKYIASVAELTYIKQQLEVDDDVERLKNIRRQKRIANNNNQ